MTVTLGACALGIGVGVAGLVVALRGRPNVGSRGGSTGSRNRSDLRKGHPNPHSPLGHPHGGVLKVAGPLLSAVIVGAITRWPVAALLAAVATAALPAALRSTRSRDLTRRAEAVAVWTELLRDTLTASSGLAQAVTATAGLAPIEIRTAAGHLADRVMSGVSMDEALRLFAVEVDDPSADEVVSALRLAASSRAQRLVDLLGALADSTRDVVAMRLRVEASRASARSGVRTVIVFSLGFVGLLMVVARSYLAPFGSVTGQLVLVLVGSCYAAGLILMVRLVRPTPGRRAAREAVRR
jgi:tight adherence protein B